MSPNQCNIAQDGFVDGTKLSFEDWNKRLAQHFFNASNAGKRVYLHTTTDLLVTLSGKPTAQADFIQAVKAGPSTSAPEDLCTKAIHMYLDWRNVGGHYPPYVAHLCLFALAAGREGPWAPHAYYPRLWDLLGTGGSGAPHNFYQMSRMLWKDLEVWTHNDMNGRLGLFKWQASGKWIYVGVPVAQTILTDAERKCLPALFRDADLEPGAAMPEGELSTAIALAARGRLRQRTCNLLASPEMNDYKAALLESIQSDLSDWDGSVPVDNGTQTDECRGGLRIWLKHIDPAGFVDSRIVAFLPDSTDAEALLLQSPHLPNKAFTCQAQSGHVTSPLKDYANGQELDASQVAWSERLQLTCSHTGMRLILPKSNLRIFVPADTHNLGGFIEARRLPSNGDFRLAAAKSIATEIACWGQRCCDPGTWRILPVVAGVPAGWTIFQGSNPKDDDTISRSYPALALPHSPKITFQGGIKVGAGGAYFPFALPDVVIEWHEKPAEVDCNKTPLRSADGFHFSLQGCQVNSVNTVDAIFTNSHLLSATFFIRSDGWSWSEGRDCPQFDKFGHQQTAGAPSIKGAAVHAETPEFIPEPDTVLEDIESAVLLGRTPGQIADLRRGGSLPKWPAVWAVTIARRTVTFAFCGGAIESCTPLPAQKDHDARRWAGLLWVNRKRIPALQHKGIRALLKQYQEVARAL